LKYEHNVSGELFTVENYFLADYPRTLFPLTTTGLLVAKFSTELKDFLYNTLLCKTSASPGFLVQQRCYSAKRGYNLRRTVKLDPVAEFFIYDIVFRNRKSFRSDHRVSRQSFGYRFCLDVQKARVTPMASTSQPSLGRDLTTE
jgi:hypothetical protein